VQGRDCRLLKLFHEAEDYVQEIDLEDEIDSLEPLLFVIKRMLDTLVARLRAGHRVVVCVVFELRYEKDQPYHAALKLAEPSSDVGVFLSLIHVHLEAFGCRSVVVGVKIEFEVAVASTAQHYLFERGLRDENRFQETMGRLEALLGGGNVGRPARRDSHRDDAFELVKKGEGGVLVEDAGIVPVRRFRPPRKVGVIYDAESPWHRPRALTNLDYGRKIRRFRGPYLSSGGWWFREESWFIREWDVEMDSRQLLRIRELLPCEEWEIVGVY
ncbi:MAG: hypothetical protein ACQKBU_05630, partial [Verrucomicrobiales bacterium]